MEGDEHKFSGDVRAADVHYFALAGIIEQAKALGLELDGLMSNPGASSSMPVDMLGELIQQARKKLYLQMMEFEVLDMDLADLHAELQDIPQQPAKPAVTLTLV